MNMSNDKETILQRSIFASLLFLTLFFALLTGCGKADPAPGMGSGDSANKETTAAGTEAASESAGSETPAGTEAASESTESGTAAGSSSGTEPASNPSDETPAAEGGNQSDAATDTEDHGTTQTEAGDHGTPLAEDADPELAARAESFLSTMSLEDKVSQLLILTPDQLTGVSGTTLAGENTRAAYNAMPAGGIICMSPNLDNTQQTQEFLANLQQFSRNRTGLPLFTFVDEEGGSVARISGQFAEYPAIQDMAVLGAAGDTAVAEETGRTIGTCLSTLGFTCDFAPVADVLSNPANQVVRDRSFGSDPALVSQMACALGRGLESQGVYAVYKHFPGHGATADDTHNGYAWTGRTLDELRACELLPFQAAIDQGAAFIMTAHISLPNAAGEDVPASLSYAMTTQLLREEMGFDGIVVTDALNMGAVANQYSSAEATVKAVEAGADMLLMPARAVSAREGLLDAVASGRLTEERIDASVRRILLLKLQM